MRIRSLFITVVVLFGMQAIAVSQQSHIRGVVIDSVTNQRIPFANVLLLGTNKGVAANDVGFFLLPAVKVGIQQVAVSAVGYERLVKSIPVREDAVSEVNFRLRPVVIESEEVVVTAQRKAELLEISTSVYVLEQRELNLVPAAAQPDVLHSLKMIPGIVSTSDVSSRFYVRGGAGDQNLFTLDGIRIYNPYHAFGIYSLFDPDIVRNVEVYTGAFPPGYGSRLSSVIQVNAQDGRSDRIAGRANANFLSSKLQLEGPSVGGITWTLNGRKSLFKKTFNKIIRQETPINFYDLFLKLSLQTEQTAKYDFSYLVSDDRLLYAEPDHPDYYWRNVAAGVNASGVLTDRIFVASTFYATSYLARRDPKASQIITATSASVKEAGVRTEATLYLDNLDKYYFGFEAAFPLLEYFLTNNLDQQVRLYNISMDLSAWIRFQTKTPRTQIDGGIHSEVGSLFYGGDLWDAIQPRVSISYLLAGDWRVKGAYGHFSQNLVTVSNEDDLISLFEAWIRVPKHLTYERANHLVAALDGSVFEGASASIQAYYKYYGSLVAYNRDKVDALDPDYTSGTGSSRGVEVLWRQKFHFADLYATYSLSWTKINHNNVEYHPRYDRRHHVNFLGVFYPVNSVEISLRWEYGSGFPFTQTIGFVDRLTLGDNLREPYYLETGKPFNILGPKNAARLPDYHRLDVSIQYNVALGPVRIVAGVHAINAYGQKNVFYFDRRTGQQVNMLGFFPSFNFSLEY